MTSDPIESGKRFAADLRRIRESQGLERADLIAALRLDPSILDEFESNGLVGHPMYNRVYLRSFASGYARVLGIDFRAVSASLDSVFEGRYRGALGVAHLGDPEPEPIETDDETIPEPAPPRAQRVRPSKQAAPARDPAVPDSAVSASSTPRRVMIRRPGVWVSLALFVVVTTVVGWLWLRSESDDPATVPPVVVESRVPMPVAPRFVVGDTMRLFVVALDTLNPIRIIVDQNLRAPFWILPGDSLPFEVSDRIVLERKADQVAVSFAGRRLPSSASDSLGTLILTRNRVQELLDSLRTAG